MVYTRQMMIGNSSGNESTELHPSDSGGPAKSTRNSTSVASSNQVVCSKNVIATNHKQSLNLLDLPQEIIEKIFGYLKFKNVCHMRLVSVRFDHICGHILNSTFQRLQHQLLERFHDIKKKMPRRESARRNHHLACESDIIETLHMRLTLLQMSLGKHIERKHCCFFPGEILDEVLHILHYIKVTPKLARPYKVTDELFDLSTMAMEYFKEKIEPDLPEIAYFTTDFLEFSSGSFPSTSSNPKYLCLDSYPMDMEESKDNDSPPPPEVAPSEVAAPSSEAATPQSNMVLRKGIRKIKQGMKRYNNQLTILRQDVRSCRQKAVEQQKLMSEQQKQLAEQQKQIVDYAGRMDENEKKNEEMSRKFSTLLQELNKCKTELQYWRSKSPATPPFCTSCGVAILPNAEELEALANQGVHPEVLGLELLASDFVPIAGGAKMADVVEAGTSSSREEAGKSDAPSVPIKGMKRKLPEEGGEQKETPNRSTAGKKSRRLLKTRQKRSKI